jgi:cell division inhibitor SepF
MNNIFSKLRDFVGLNEQVEYEYYEEEADTDNYQNLYQQENPQPAPAEAAPANRRWREPMSTIGDEVATGTKSTMGSCISYQ